MVIYVGCDRVFAMKRKAAGLLHNKYSERIQAMKEIVRRYRTDRFKWNDFILFPVLISFIIVFIGQIAGTILVGAVIPFFENEKNSEFLSFFSIYLATIGSWVLGLLIFLIPSNRPMFGALGKKCKGNRIKFFCLGILIGFVTNALCILCAVLHGDIHLYFRGGDVSAFLLLLLAVFIQSASEELACRVFLYQRIRRGYKSPVVAILGNGVVFAAMHLMSPGINPLAVVSIIAVAVSYSLFVYYCDSVWLPMGAHMAWNFTQNIIFGLPNSGIVSGFSLFKLDAASATNSFAYNTEFGVEATVMTVAELIICSLLTIYWGRKNNKKPTDIWNS